jgi:hypothetical protein
MRWVNAVESKKAKTNILANAKKRLSQNRFAVQHECQPLAKKMAASSHLAGDCAAHGVAPVCHMRLIEALRQATTEVGLGAGRAALR